MNYIYWKFAIEMVLIVAVLSYAVNRLLNGDITGLLVAMTFLAVEVRAAIRESISPGARND